VVGASRPLLHTWCLCFRIFWILLNDLRLAPSFHFFKHINLARNAPQIIVCNCDDFVLKEIQWIDSYKTTPLSWNAESNRTPSEQLVNALAIKLSTQKKERLKCCLTTKSSIKFFSPQLQKAIGVTFSYSSLGKKFEYKLKSMLWKPGWLWKTKKMLVFLRQVDQSDGKEEWERENILSLSFWQPAAYSSIFLQTDRQTDQWEWLVVYCHSP